MKPPSDVRVALRQELSDWRRWATRGLVLLAAVAAGLTVVAFTWLSERALHLFTGMLAAVAWLPLAWTPLNAAAIVWLTRRWAPGAAGSGIPQVMAALDTGLAAADRGLFVSLRLTLSKMLLTAWGLLAGLSMGREGPSVQIAAGVMHHARRWLPERSSVSDHGLLVAGGAAGIAAAFNTPLAGVIFAIEELSRKPEQRSSGLLVAAIVLAGLMAVSAYGNSTYFGVIRVRDTGWALLGPGLLVALASGAAGGLFSRLLLASLSGRGSDRFSRWRAARPVLFAAGCGLGVALLGLASGGAVFGSGYLHTRGLLEGGESTPVLFMTLKFVATWLTAWSGVPAGIFAPSLSIGAGLGHDVALLTGYADRPALIALGMAGFLAAATQAPLTAFIIVMEMVDGHGMVLSLMACAMLANLVSKLLTPPLYATLAQWQLQRAAPIPATGPIAAAPDAR